ncbi:MAG: universal stress protein [Deltaproteobacteria bacterium]|nr:universal stress protein [Deltaproteobacteria bacterium]
MKRILVALDGSPRAGTVLAAALQLAELTEAKLIAYRAIGVPPEMSSAILVGGDQLERVLEATARAELERLVRDVPSPRLEAIETAFATPWDGICRAAREREADLIVIGSHGYHGLDRLLGTTAAKVVNHADRNVLVVRTHL